MLKTTILSIFIIVIFGLIGIKTLFHSGFYTSHDGEHQVIRLYQFDQALKDGQIPPRWAGTAENGYGYPLFVFSYQSPWFVGVPLLRLGFSLVDSIKAVFIIGFMASSLFMFLWLKDMLGLWPGFTGAILYLWTPYRFSNIFVRASLGEATTFIFVPLIFWGIWRLREEKWMKSGLIFTCLGLSGLILSHLMGVIIFVAPILFWAILRIQNSKEKLKVTKKILFACLLGIFLTAYYLIPAVYEQRYTKASEILSPQYQDHFVSLQQLIYSKWGYGFDFPGVEHDAMSFQIGIAQWASIAILTFIVMINLLKKKRLDKTGLFVILIFFFSIFMMLDVSKVIWEIVIRLSYFDFPWRFLGLSVFAGSLGAALVVNYLKKISWIIAIFLISMALFANRNHLRVNQYTYMDDVFYKNNTQTTNMYDEYRPKTLSSDYIKKSRDRIEIDRSIVIIDKQTSKSNYLSIEGESDKDTTAKINIAYYPGWKAWVNKIEQSYITSAEGVITAKIPKGKFTLESRFTDTPIRTLSNILTILSCISIITVAVKKSSI
jgi:hypothetical protein